MTAHPVRVAIVSPAHFDRMQLLLRVGLCAVLGLVGVTTGWLTAVLYLALPVVVALAVSSEGADLAANEVGPRLWAVLVVVVRLAAYMMLLVDRFPSAGQGDVAPAIAYTGRPTVGSALARIVTSVPSAFVLSVLWCISWFVTVMSSAFVLVGTRIPMAFHAYQRGVLRWTARLLAYHASLVAEYPPWALDTDESAAPAAFAGAR